jgi:tetratricopeptide (TPR) repeat protein
MKRFFFIGIMLLIVAGGWVIKTYEHETKSQVDGSAIKQLVVEGEKALNIGRYTDAKHVFAEELKLNPKNPQAEWGLKKAQIRESLSGAEFKMAVDDLYKQNSMDGHVNLFLGEFYAGNHEFEKAQSYYESAIELDPSLAEAHYDLAAIYEQQGNLNAARVEYLKAISISPEARYQNSLATIYFKQKQYEAAVKAYGKNLEYPLSSLASAKIFWRLGYLSQALNYQKEAVKFLENEVVMLKPENQEAWFIEVGPGEVIKLATIEEKKSYAYLSLAATLYLHGDAVEAESKVQKANQLAVAKQASINTLLKTELETLMLGNAELLELVEIFKNRYL